MINHLRSMMKLIWSVVVLAGYCWYMIASVHVVVWSKFFCHLLALSKLGWRMTFKMNFVFLDDSLPKMFPLILAVAIHSNQLVERVITCHCQHLSSCQRTSDLVALWWQAITLTTTLFLWWVDSRAYLDSQDNEFRNNGVVEWNTGSCVANSIQTL